MTRSMKISLVILSGLAAAVVAFRLLSPPVVRRPPAEILDIGTLPSGEHVRLIDGPLPVDVPGVGAAFLLPYVSRLTLTDQSALRAEATAVWGVFDPGQSTRWVLRPMRMAGASAEAIGRDFIFEKDANGTWKLRDDH
jgi:hypothetical protein